MDVETLLASLRAGELPARARRWLIIGFERWQQGAVLEAALGLDTTAPLDRRDESLRMALQLAPGGSDTAKCAYIVECLNGDREHASTMAAEVLHKLRASGGQVPRSIRHLTRILNGSRAASETESGWLCPAWPLPENAGNTKEQAK